MLERRAYTSLRMEIYTAKSGISTYYHLSSMGRKVMNDVVSRMVKEFPAETLRLIFSDKSEQFQIEKAVSEFKVSAQFIKKWINENRLPESMIERVEMLYKDHLNKTVENLRKEANEKVRIRAV